MKPDRAKLLLLAEAAVVALAVTLFYAPLLDGTRMQGGGDFANLFWPLKELRLHALREAGAVLLWNPYVFLGTPAAATMQHAVFYPIDYLFFWRSPTLPALNWYVLFHNVLCGVGAWWWMRFGWRAGVAGALLAGCTYPCTAWFWGAQEHINQVGTVAWMPWLLGLAWMFAEGRLRARAFVAWYAALGALQFLVGHPQAAFYTHAVAGLMIVLRGVARWRHAGWPAVARPLVVFLGAGILIGLLVAVQLLPALELSRLSYRQYQDVDPAYSMSFSMPPDVLRTFLNANAFGTYLDGYVDGRAYNEYGLFVGWGVLVLGLFGAVVLGRARRWRRLMLLAGLLVAGIVMAMGGNVSARRIVHGDFTEFPAPASRAASIMQDVRVDDWESVGRASPLDVSLHEVYIALVPPARGFRVPARVLVVTALMWVTLAGFGLDALVRAARARRREAGLAVAACGVAVCWLALLVPSAPQKFRFPKDTAPLLLEWEQDRAQWSGASLDGRLLRLTPDDIHYTLAERERPAELLFEQNTGGNGPWQRWMRLMENNNAVLRLPALEGYEEGLAPTVRTKDFLFAFNRNLRDFPPDMQLLALLGVNRVFADRPVDESALPFLPRESRTLRRLHDVPPFRGAAFWAMQADGVDFAALEGPAWGGGAPLGRRQERQRRYGVAADWFGEWPRLTTDTTNPNRVVVRSTGHVPGDAILSMAWAPGWRVGDAEAEWLGAVHVRIPRECFRDGVAELRYEPRSYRVGLFLTALGGALWGFLLLGDCRRLLPVTPSPAPGCVTP